MNLNWPNRYFFAFICSFVVATVLTAILVKILPRLDIVDRPNDRKIHTTPIPRMGGIAIFAGFVVPMLWIHYFSDPQKGIMLGGGIALIIGALDDLFGVPALIKLLSLCVLTVLLSYFDVMITLPIPIEGNLIITIIWIAGVTSALNALDHMDGLAGGVAAIAAAMYLLVSIQTQQFFWGLVSVSLIGSLSGYLIFNRHPAKIFMGDSGSFFLGFTLAAIGIMGGWSDNAVKAAIVPIAILSLPIFDLCFVIITRRLNGTTKTLFEAITYCGKDHMGHRLMTMGFSIRQTVSIVYLISCSIAFAALAMRHANTLEAVLISVQLVLVYVIIIVFMKHGVAKSKQKQEAATNAT